jgi:glycosyltransferase involved in cell wall biosynthesis
MGGATEIIKEGISGIFAKPLDGADMASKVEWLLDHPRIRCVMSEHAIQRAQQYRWESVLDHLFDSYDNVIQEYKHKQHSYKAA